MRAKVKFVATKAKAGSSLRRRYRSGSARNDKVLIDQDRSDPSGNDKVLIDQDSSILAGMTKF